MNYDIPDDLVPYIRATIRAVPTPANLAGRPVCALGYPVPFHTAWLTKKGKPAREGCGRPKFRLIDRTKARQCVEDDLCWLCGRALWKSRALVLGSSNLTDGTTAFPDLHPDCAEYVVKAYPWMALSDPTSVSALFIHWQRPLLRIAQPGSLPLFRIPEDPRRLTFWAEGRRAGRSEAIASLEQWRVDLGFWVTGFGKDAEAEFNAGYQRAIALVERWTDDFDGTGHPAKAPSAGARPG